MVEEVSVAGIMVKDIENWNKYFDESLKYDFIVINTENLIINSDEIDKSTLVKFKPVKFIDNTYCVDINLVTSYVDTNKIFYEKNSMKSYAIKAIELSCEDTIAVQTKNDTSCKYFTVKSVSTHFRFQSTDTEGVNKILLCYPTIGARGHNDSEWREVLFSDILRKIQLPKTGDKLCYFDENDNIVFPGTVESVKKVDDGGYIVEFVDDNGNKTLKDLVNCFKNIEEATDYLLNIITK